MIFVNLVILVISVMLAIISRKHFSKYKDGKGFKSSLKAFVLSVGYSGWILINYVLHMEGIRERLRKSLRKNQIVSPKRLEAITDKCIAGFIGVGLGILFTFNLLDLGSMFYSLVFRDRANYIEREEYGGDVVEQEIYYEHGGNETSFILSVSPIRLSEEEFYIKAQELVEDIEREYFPEDKIISSDVELPLTDDEGVFIISWESDKPDILSSKGRINEQIEQEIFCVNLKMYISYYDHHAEHTYALKVGHEKKTDEQLVKEELIQALNNLEQQGVYEQTLILPEQVNNIEIWTKSDEVNRGRLLMVGVLLAVVVLGLYVSRIREQGKIRDRQLMKEYPCFVDSLWLYIQAGMTIKRAMQEYLKAVDDREGILAKEIHYTINQIENGEAEYIAYEELGARINLTSYVSLMRHISQNLKMGTKDLKSLMETEVTMALEAKKENAKKLGEEASTKLVFPMIVLLIVVMLMIMTPAFVGF